MNALQSFYFQFLYLKDKCSSEEVKTHNIKPCLGGRIRRHGLVIQNILKACEVDML